MPLDSLNRFDNATASAKLAGAALATAANPGVPGSEEDVAEPYRAEIDAVIAEIRKKLKLSGDDFSPKARASLDSYIARALDETVLAGTDTDAALARAGQAAGFRPRSTR